MELLIAILIFIIACAVIFWLLQSYVLPAIPDTRLRGLVLAIVGLLAILAFLRYVLHIV